jgi:hypothetical protein
MKWIVEHQLEVQAFSAIGTILLTFALIVITGFYAWANWKTMRLMEADVRFRLKPVPHLGIKGMGTFLAAGTQEYTVHIRSVHAPLRLVALSAVFKTPKGKTEEHRQTFNRQIVSETPFESQLHVHVDQPPSSWVVTLYYHDLSGFLDYATTFNEQGYVSEEKTIDRKEFRTSMTTWIQRKFAKSPTNAS